MKTETLNEVLKAETAKEIRGNGIGLTSMPIPDDFWSKFDAAYKDGKLKIPPTKGDK